MGVIAQIQVFNDIKKFHEKTKNNSEILVVISITAAAAHNAPFLFKKNLKDMLWLKFAQIC